jgi:curved DNA-binding protein CbpA
MQAPRDAYRVLQIDPEADWTVLHAAFRALARHYHPDGTAPDLQRMAELNQAYALVRTPELRAEYDRRRQGIKPPVPPEQAARPGVPPPAAGGVFARGAARRGDAAAPASSSSRLDFGRYAGWTVEQVAHQDPDYLRWLARHSSGLRFRSEIARALAAEDQSRSASSRT